MLAALLGLAFLVFKMRNKKEWFYIYLIQGIGILYSMVIFDMFIGNMDVYEPFHLIVIPYICCFLFSNMIYSLVRRKKN